MLYSESIKATWRIAGEGRIMVKKFKRSGMVLGEDMGLVDKMGEQEHPKLQRAQRRGAGRRASCEEQEMELTPDWRISTKPT